MISTFKWQVSRVSPFPSEFESQSQFPSLFPASSLLSLSLVSTAFSLRCICVLYCISLHALFVLLCLLRSCVIASSFTVFSLQFSAFSNWPHFDRISARSCDTKALVITLPLSPLSAFDQYFGTKPLSCQRLQRICGISLIGLGFPCADRKEIGG